jgi:peptidoglycan/LPS O-acetylase OafA/YrhL
MKNRIPALDGIRGLALLLVVFYHVIVFGRVHAVSLPERLIEFLAIQSWIGVDLFFVLSGFLITGILLQTRDTEHYYRNFIMRRVLRIFPLYYLFIVLFFLILPVLFPWHTELQKLPPLQAWYWLYIPNVRVFLQGDWYASYGEHTWSLAIEEQFYLLWPLVVLVARRKYLLWIGGIGTLCSLAFRIWLTSHGADYAKTLVLTPAHLDGVLLGSMLAVLIERPTDDPQKLRRLLLAAVGTAVVGLVATAVAPLNYATKHYAFTVTWASLLFAAVMGLIVTGRPGSWLERIFGNRVLRFVGFYSYGLYLFHESIFRELGRHLPTRTGPPLVHWIAMTIVGSTLSILLAMAVYHAYEARFLSLKRFFPTGKPRSPNEIAPLEDRAFPRVKQHSTGQSDL